MSRALRFERGFSLIELMVSMGIGLIVLLAATQLFIANQVNFNFQRGTADVQTGGRFATDMVVRDIRTSGLAIFGDATVPGIILQLADLPGLTDANMLTRDSASTAAATGSISANDQLLIQYGTLTAAQDCEGNDVAANTYVLARYFVRIDQDTGSAALACDAGTRNGATVTGLSTASTAGAVLVSGVDSFQILLGLDDGPNTPANVRANRYVNIATYNDNTVFPAPKPRVVGIRIGVLVRSQERVGDPAPRSTNPASDIQVLDNVIPYNTGAQTAALDDGRMRRLFVATAGLRNLDTTGL
jgi:type IV pilus assembly protein PilW